MIAYQSAYLKAHYPVQFMCALLTQDMGNQDKTTKYIAECRNMDIRILPPDINMSQVNFTLVEAQIRFGLAAVEDVDLGVAERIVLERDNQGPFVDLPDFCRRVGKTEAERRDLESLIQSGAFDFVKNSTVQIS